MYAIIQVGGNQYRVNSGSSIEVDRLKAKAGDVLQFPALLVANDSEVKMGMEAAEVMVNATIVSHIQGDKVRTLRFRAKSRHRRRHGMRPQLTVLKITTIGTKSPEKSVVSTTPKARVRKTKKTSTK